MADLPEVAGGRRHFRGLFVGGSAARARLPKQGCYPIEELPGAGSEERGDGAATAAGFRPADLSRVGPRPPERPPTE